MKTIARDGIILSNSWGFRLDEIRVPVYLWHGEEDRNVSLESARYIARAKPGCISRLVPGKGHCLLFECRDDILAELTA